MKNLSANSGAITYNLINGKWHYYHWPKGIYNLTEWGKYQIEHPNWSEEAGWKLCKEEEE